MERARAHRAPPRVARASPTSIRATSCGPSRWWTRTTAGRWTSTRRRRMLEEVERGRPAMPRAGSDSCGNWSRAPEDGRLKLHVIRAALAARAARPGGVRARAIYVPLAAAGPARRAWWRSAAGEGAERLVAVVPRLVAAHVPRRRGAHRSPGCGPAPRLPLPAGLAVDAGPACSADGASSAEPDGGLRLAELFGILPVALLLADHDG